MWYSARPLAQPWGDAKAIVLQCLVSSHWGDKEETNLTPSDVISQALWRIFEALRRQILDNRVAGVPVLHPPSDYLLYF